jgi:hypothetical protein
MLIDCENVCDGISFEPGHSRTPFFYGGENKNLEAASLIRSIVAKQIDRPRSFVAARDKVSDLLMSLRTFLAAYGLDDEEAEENSSSET